MSARNLYDAVCVGAHPDDVEIGMGATVAKLAGAGARVAIVDLTNGEPTPCGTPEKRAEEAERAAEILGAERRTLTLPNRYLFDTKEARTMLAEVLREMRPRMLFVPYSADAHPDHVAASSIALAARFYGKLTKTEMLGTPFYVPRVFHYMAVHQKMIVQPSFIVSVGETLEAKLDSIRAYRSQFEENPSNAQFIDVIRDTALMWGDMARAGAGEPFFALEPVTLDSPALVL